MTSLPRLYGGSQAPLGIVEPEEEQFISKSPWPDVMIPEVNLADFVWEHVDQYPAAIAVVCGMTGRSYTYSVARDMAKKFGAALLKLGVQDGEVLAISLPNMPEFPVAFLGAVGVGVTVTTMNPTYKAEEMVRQLNNSGAKYILTCGSGLPNVLQASEVCEEVKNIIVVDIEDTPPNCIRFLDMVRDADLEQYNSKKGTTDIHTHTAAIPYSSGTTGPTKGIHLSHFNLVSSSVQSLAQGVAPSFSNVLEGDQQETILAVIPFFHIYSLSMALMTHLRLGNQLVTLPKFEQETYRKALTTFKPTVLHVVPPILSYLASNKNVKASHLSSVKFIIGSAAPFGSALIQSFLDKVPPGSIDFREVFGMTETSQMTHCQPAGDKALLGSCGWPVPNTRAKLVDLETGEAVGSGHWGELCISGPQVMMGYHRNSRTTRNALKDHWLHTGDIATCHKETGQLIFVDRMKEMIKVKGLYVAPSELEECIRGHPGVMDVAVVGVPDELTGESSMAYIIRKNRNLKEDSIIEWMCQRMETHKRIGTVMFVESIPKNSIGKTIRRQLRAQVFKGSFGY